MLPAKLKVEYMYLKVLEGAEFETDWEKVKIQQLGIGNEGKNPVKSAIPKFKI